MEIIHLKKSQYVDPFDRLIDALEAEMNSATQLSRLIDEVDTLRQNYNTELNQLRDKYQPKIDAVIAKINQIV